MKVSYSWLKEFVDFNIPPDELGHLLTMAGLEVEAVEEIEGDTVFDIGVTPNRPDCLSIRGIAREVSALLELPFKDIQVHMDSEEGDGPSVEIDNPKLCPRYSSKIINGVKTEPSPEWLSKRLESCGIRPTSNIVDVTNYVLLELGQPMHAFDLDTLEGKRIVVKQAGDADTFTTLDGEERKISSDTLLIWDADKPVAVAGIMGGSDTEVTEDTKNILLESACFDPSSVRRTSRSLNLSSESSYRFERGIDREAVTLALDRAAELITEISGGRVTHTTDIYPEKYEPEDIKVSMDRIDEIIGIAIDRTFIENSLRKLGLTVTINNNVLTVTPPAYRPDLERDIDIIEEVARIYGYDKIPSTLPSMHMNAAPEHKQQELVKTMKNYFVRSGFSEVINYSFLSPDVLDKLNLPAEDKRRNLIYIKNPLRKEESAMRTSLVPALLSNIQLNLNRGEKALRFFEISRVYIPGSQKLPDEITQICAVLRKEPSGSLWHDKHIGFYDLKGVFENIFSDLKIRDVTFAGDTTEPYLHPGKSCSIYIGREKAGVMGVLHPGVSEAFEIKGDITIAEIHDIKNILDGIPSEITYTPLQKYPYIERDLALIIDDDVTVDSVRKEIFSVETDILENVTLFDIYKGKPVPADKKSLAFSIRYRSAEKTLTDSEVDDLHSRILNRLRDNLKVELRS